MKAITAEMSSRYAILTSSNLISCPRNLLRRSCEFFTIKYLAPARPPQPKFVEASTNYSSLALGRWPKIKSYDRPLFFNKINFHISNAFFIDLETGIRLRLFWLFKAQERTDKKGLPNGDTYAAYVKLPTSFSSFLNSIYVDWRTATTRLIYLCCFSFDKRQDLAMASYINPRISMTLAGAKHLLKFIFAPVSSPTAIKDSNNKSALGRLLLLLLFDFIGPPKKSST